MDKNIYKNFLREIEIEKRFETPCQKSYQFSNKLIKKVQLVLKKLDQEHNHSLAVELFEKNKNNLDNITRCAS